MKSVLLLLGLPSLVCVAWAHDGILPNANGCHRLSYSTAGYHCHGGSVQEVQSKSNRDGDLDCSDFSSQLEAQWFYEKNQPFWDPHRLDADCDWIACEGNGDPISAIAAQAMSEGWLQVLDEAQIMGVNSCPRVRPL